MNDPCDSRSLSLDESGQGEPLAEPEPAEPSRPASGAEVAASPGADGGLQLDIVIEAGDWSGFGSHEVLQRLIRAAAGSLARHRACAHEMPAAVGVALSSDGRLRELNRCYRGHDKPTNVLSFPYGDDGTFAPAQGEPRCIGDIVLAAATIEREARALAIEPAHHLKHLVIHGLLHLLGYDHESDDEARKMQALEVAILDDLGICDPYAARPLAPAKS